MGEQAGRPGKSAAEDLILRTIAEHADSLLRTARRHSICADDAQDAYQRGLEIFIRHAHRLDPGRAGAWLHTVVKREAKALRRSRQRLVGSEEFDADGQEARRLPTPEEQLAEGPECPSAPVFRTRSLEFAVKAVNLQGRTPPNRPRDSDVAVRGLATKRTRPLRGSVEVLLVAGGRWTRSRRREAGADHDGPTRCGARRWRSWPAT